MTAGAGLSGGGAGGDVQLSVDTTAIQARIANPCPAGQAITSVAANGAPTCVPVGTGDITQVTAGNGLNGGGAEGAVTLSVDTSAIQARLANACPAGQAIASVSAAGAVGCVAVGTGDITRVSVGPGLTGGGQSGDVTIGFDPTALQARVADPCPAGQAIVSIDQNGGRTCGPLGTGDITQVTAGNGLIGGGASGAVALAVDATAFQARLRSVCPANEAMTGVDQAGNVACQPVGDIQGVTAGFGLTGGAGSGTATLNVDTNTVQARVVGSCPNAGEFMTAIGNNGQATCANVYGTTEAVTHYGAAGRLGATALFQPDGGDNGVFLEGRSGGEGGGFFANGDVAAIWSPGDGGARVAGVDNGAVLLAIYDEDNFGGADVPAMFSFSNFGSRAFAAHNGAYLSGGRVWTNTSDVALKDDFATVDADAVLEGIGALPITEWSYDNEKDGGVRHLGPMAQDFYDAFGLGYDEKSIPTVDADGVALAGIQALRDRNLKLQARVEELEARLAAIEARLR